MSILLTARKVGLARALEDAGDLFVVGRQAGLAVDEEDDRVGLLGGHERLVADRGLERIDGSPDSIPPVSMSRKSTPFQSALVVAAVARDASRLVDDGVGLSG